MARISLGEVALIALVAGFAAFLGAGGALLVFQKEKPAPVVEGKAPVDLYEGCSDEVARFCNQKSTLEALALCLEQAKPQASPECEKSIRKVNAFMLPCGPEVRKFCSEVPLGDGRLYRCVKKEIAQASESCARTIMATETASKKASGQSH